MKTPQSPEVNMHQRRERGRAVIFLSLLAFALLTWG